MLEALRKEAAKLLQEKRAALVIGFTDRPSRPALFVAKPEDCGRLFYDAACRQNLAAYLGKPEVRARLPVAVVASPAVLRSLVVLTAESQAAPGQVLALAVDRDSFLGTFDAARAAELLRAKYPELGPEPALLERVRELSKKSASERAAFWAEEFAKCTRCYACRAACPGCYCSRCIVEKNAPQWVSTAALGHGNYTWNVMRAFHQSGRCTLCGACEAACPQGLPLMLLNAALDREALEEFGARPGYDPEAKPLIGSWNTEDDHSYMR
jgi:ferredoxin